MGMHSYIRLRRVWAGGLILLAVFSAGGCATLRLENARRVSDANWLSDGKTTDRSRYLRVDVVPPLEEVWHYNAIGGFGPGSPLIVQNALVVANRKGEIHSIALDSGKKLGVKGFGQSIEGTPVIKTGIAFVPNGWGDIAVSAYDITNASMKWKTKGPAVDTSPLLVDGHLITFDSEGTVRSQLPADGSEEWTFSLGDRVAGQASPLDIGGGRVFAVADNGDAVALNAGDGSTLWNAQLKAPVYADPSMSGGLLFVPTTTGTLRAIDAGTGHEVWRFDAENPDVHLGAVASDGITAYMGASNGKLYALDVATGRQRWEYHGPDAFTAAPLIVNDNLYIGSMGRRLYGFDRTSGDLIWEVKLRGRIKSAMAARSGELIVLSEPHHVYLFREQSGKKDETSTE